MKKRGAVLALSLLAACGQREDGISQVSTTVHYTPHFRGAPADHVLEIELTMPRAFRVTNLGEITMTDPAGRRWPATHASLGESDGRQRVGAKFEVAEDTRFGVVHIGDLDVDVRSGRVTRTAQTAPTSGTPRSP